MITIDLATKIINPSQNIWVIHPGQNRRFYNVFASRNLVFLDMPKLGLSKQTTESVEKIRQHVRMSLAWKKYYLSKDNTTKPPSSNPRSYSDGSDTALNGAVGNVIGLFRTAKKGDLVVVTGYGRVSVLIGEISDSFSPEKTIALERYDNNVVHYRSIKWISTEYTKSDLPADLQERLINRKAAIKLPRDSVSEKIYRFAYKSYILGEKSKIDLEGKKYSGKNPTELNASTTLLAYIASGYAACKQGQASSFAKLEIEDAIDKFYDPQYMDNFFQEFRSPGKFQLFAASAGLAIVTTIMVTLLTSSLSTKQLHEKLDVINSVSGIDDEAETEAKNCCEELLKSLGDQRLNDIKNLAKKANNQIGLKTSAQIK